MPSDYVLLTIAAAMMIANFLGAAFSIKAPARPHLNPCEL
jgi:hypothetical protein